ncbi:hypothetical protein AA313_de0202195 [Arthrobotrys entomopaga]|nr:hypothetical protein AA313_de0202195 [Arthrobotrys entomopaga]
MSLFNALASIAASTLTSALLEANSSTASGNNGRNNKQTISDAQEIPPPTPRIVELSSPLPGPRDPASLPRPRSRRQEASTLRNTPQESSSSSSSPMTGLPLNSIWTTMSYPIPRGPCLQKSSLISACSCQRFMVHPLKATTSFDCDGCGHHASFHRMKSHEEEVENAAKFRESMMNVQGQLNSPPRAATNNGGGGGGGERRLLRDGRVEEVGEEEEDDDTLDGEEYGDQKKRRAIAGREGSEDASEGATAGRRTRKAVAVSSSSRGGKRKRNGDQILID